MPNTRLIEGFGGKDGVRASRIKKEWRSLKAAIFDRTTTVLHVSSTKTLDFVRDAKKEGLLVTAEVSPHHLFFNTDSIDENNLSFKMNPPIRSKSDQDALWQALINGTIDFVSTDHAPHESLKKTGQLSTKRLVEVFSKNPAGFLSLPNGFGEFTKAYEFHGERIF